MPGIPSTIRPKFCPFCNQSTKRKVLRLDNGYFFVRCLECGAMGPLRSDQNDAVNSWNNHISKKHQHAAPVPIDIKLAKLPQIMQDIIAYAIKNEGVLFRHHGKYWAELDWKKGEPYFGTSTIKALVHRGFMQYSAFKMIDGNDFPVQVRLLQARNVS